MYIQDPNSFFEVDEFVRSSSQQYHLSVFSSTSKMKDAFAEYLESHPSTKAIFVGTRRTDPHGAPLTHFAPTNGGWPDFMRIHPVIDWHYREIWGVSPTTRLSGPDADTEPSSYGISIYHTAHYTTLDIPAWAEQPTRFLTRSSGNQTRQINIPTSRRTSCKRMKKRGLAGRSDLCN